MNEEFILSWKEKLTRKKLEFLAFLEMFTEKDNTRVDLSAQKAHLLVFSRIDCLDCANCCKTTPAILTKKDIKRIAQSLKMTPKKFIYHYVLEDINRELSFRKVPCVFLQDDNKCRIYEVRPKACREYPHSDRPGFNFNKKLHQKNLDICPAIVEILEEMKKDFTDK